MQYMFDTIDIEDIKQYSEFYPITGITSNPSIIKLEGKIDLFNHFKGIRKIIGMDKTLHIQAVSEDYEGIMAEATVIIKNVVDDFASDFETIFVKGVSNVDL